MHLAINMLALFAMLAFAWVMFFVWLIATICRGVWRGVSRISGLTPRRQFTTVAQTRCRRVRCRAMNPPQANFCRRCGAPLTYTRATSRPQPASDRFTQTSPPISL